MAETLKAQYMRDGYVTLSELFTPEEVAALKDAARQVIRELPEGEGREVAKTGVYVGMAAASDVFRSAAAHPKLVPALQEVIGEHVVFLSDKIVFKNAAADFGSPWHQDYPYWLGQHKLSVWIALDNATPDNGCLRVVPGSHAAGAIEHGGDASDGIGFGNRLKPSDIDPSQIVDLPALQGDVILFHDLLFHASYPNQSGKDRWALISTYRNGAEEDLEYAWAKAAFAVSGAV